MSKINPNREIEFQYLTHFQKWTLIRLSKVHNEELSGLNLIKGACVSAFLQKPKLDDVHEDLRFLVNNDLIEISKSSVKTADMEYRVSENGALLAKYAIAVVTQYVSTHYNELIKELDDKILVRELEEMIEGRLEPIHDEFGVERSSQKQFRSVIDFGLSNINGFSTLFIAAIDALKSVS